MKKIINDLRLDKFIISHDKTIRDAIVLFEKTNGLPLIVLNDDREYLGILSSGDIRKFLSNDKNLLHDCIEKAINKSSIYCFNNDDESVYAHYLFKDQIRIVPIVDEERKLVSVAYFGDINFKISGNYLTHEDNQIYLIAEIGVNHNGNYNEALKLIDHIFDSGFNAVKMQFRSNMTYSYPDDFDDLDLATEYIISEINRTNINEDEEKLIVNYIKEKGLDFIGTPFDTLSLKRLVKLKPDAIKIASCDLNNQLLIDECTEYNLPIILSTGMSTETEIISVNNFLEQKNINKCFLHCNSTYPTPIEDNNLRYINRMKDITKSIVGFSSHNGDPTIPIAAAAIGAKVIEIHVTFDRDAEGTDHSSSLIVNELKKFVKDIKNVAYALGNQNPRIPTQGELMNKLALGKSLCYKFDLKKGHIIKSERDLISASPGDGIEVNKYGLFENKVLKKDVIKLEKLKYADFHKKNFLVETQKNVTLQDFTRNILKEYEWGIPVRYRDIIKFNNLFNPPLFEIHLSSKDLKYNLNKINSKDIKNKKFLVHAIEQYHDGFIFDLASDSNEIINESFERMSETLNHCNRIYELFNPKNNIQIILNCGGYSKNSFLKSKEILDKEKILIDNLITLKNKHSDFEFLPQTMPPFPWHQGGRSFHNLLRSKESLIKLNKETGLRICLDFSHTYMNCEFLNLNFVDEIKEILHITRHLHLSDSISNSSEGLNIGDGKINFVDCFNLIYGDSKKNISFIPEVWQGHLNEGKNFKLSLERIAKLLKSI